MAKKPPSREKGRIYIDELESIVHRKVGTIRRWESEEWLPNHLLPKRGTRGWRYWTTAQVHGPRGIIAWMKKNDMRPGNLLADPEREAEHIEHLRRPKFLTGHHIRSVKIWVESGKKREYIVRKLFPRTKYAKPENLERALVRYFSAQGWDFPPPTPKKKQPKLSKRAQRDIAALEKRIKQLGG